MFDINVGAGFPASVALILQIHHAHMKEAYNKGGRSRENTEAAAGTEARKEAKKGEVAENQGQGTFASSDGTEPERMTLSDGHADAVNVN